MIRGRIHPDGSSDVIARLLLIAWPGYKQRDIQKNHEVRGSDGGRINRWEDVQIAFVR